MSYALRARLADSADFRFQIRIAFTKAVQATLADPEVDKKEKAALIGAARRPEQYITMAVNLAAAAVSDPESVSDEEAQAIISGALPLLLEGIS